MKVILAPDFRRFTVAFHTSQERLSSVQTRISHLGTHRSHNSIAWRLMTLLSLPSDLLTHVLQQEGIGTLELCRLECCSTTMRRLIDNGLWKQAFLRVHRPRALGEPSSWKQELKLRRAWSSGWRTLAACAAPLPDLAPAAVASTLCSASTTTRTRSGNVMKQKLRRFALNIVSTVPLAPPPRWSTLVVDAGSSEPGVFRTINAAMLCCKPYDRILIRPGVYFEQITIDKPVELMGVGGNAAAVIVGTDGPAIEVRFRPAAPAQQATRTLARLVARKVSGTHPLLSRPRTPTPRGPRTHPHPCSLSAYPPSPPALSRRPLR